MGLTRPRAYQIYDIDYKQAVRVITRTNITLSGGAPSQVDGVNLSLNDRVLVAGQNNGAQNGLYYVTTVGSGSTGTWQRSIDGNETGEIQAGMIVMVTEGTTYADTQWKLITNNPIVIGTTALSFEQTSAYSFGSIAVSGQNSIVADTVGDVLTVIAGNNIALTTNDVTDALTISVTGISLNSISNGSSNVNVVSSGGNVSIGVGGTSNVGVFSATGLTITGDLNVTGNATLSGNILGDKIVNGNTSFEIQTPSGNANISVAGTTNVAVFTSTGQNLTGALVTSGNVTGGNIITTGNVNASQGFFSSNVTVVGTFTSTSNIVANTSGIFYGNTVTGNDAIFAGLPSFTSLGSNVVAQFSGNANSYSQINFENTSSGNRASTDYIATADNGTDSTNYADFGINSSTFDDPVNYPGYGPNDSYVHNHGGNLILNPESSGKTIKFMVGGTSNSNVVGTVTTTGIDVTGAISATGNITGGNILGNGAGLSGINSFSTIAVSGQSNVVADSIADTLTLAAGTGISITTSAGNDTITIASIATDSIFATGGDMGTVDQVTTVSEDLGLITSSVTVSYDLGTITTGGIVTPSLFLLPSYTVSGLPTASPAGQMAYVTNEAGGAVPAFSDGTNWRRVTDRAIVS